MNFEDIRPFIRHTEQVSSILMKPEIRLKSYDNCIVYTLSGNGTIYIANRKYKMSKGSVLMWRAGTDYLFSSDDSDAVYIIIHFDFTDRKRITNNFHVTPEPPDIFAVNYILDSTVFDDCPEFNSTIYVKSVRTLEEYFLGVVSEFKKPKRHMNMRASAKMIIILTEISNSFHIGTASKPTDKADEIIEYIHQHYTGELTNTDIAHHFNFHPQHINKIIRRKTGYSLHKYVIMRRISKAIDLLETTKMPIAEISDNIGFQNVCHFSRYFKEFMGTNPRSYRQQTKR